MSLPTKTSPTRHGFTLIEMIVVVTVLSIVAVLVIPTVRTMNEDRQVRDTARIVGAFFSKAREQAAVDGVAGIELWSVPRNPAEPNRDLWQYNAPNLAVVLYQLRAIPPYLGDTLGSTAEVIGTGTGPNEFVIEFAIDELRDSTQPTFEEQFVAGCFPGDLIEINNSGVRLEIVSITDGGAVAGIPNPDSLIVNNPSPNPQLPMGEMVDYKIFRQPQRVESSVLRLPNNFFVNMAMSGHGTTLGASGSSVGGNELMGRQFRNFASPLTPTGHSHGRTRILFAADGSVSRVTTRSIFTTATPPNTEALETPNGPIQLLMCNALRDSVDLTNLDAPEYLYDPNNLWITIDHRTGSVVVGRIASQIDRTGNIREQVQEARALTGRRVAINP